jgi:Nuclease-related domain
MVPRRPGQFLEERIERKALLAGACIAVVWAVAGLGFRWWPLSLVVAPAVFVVDRQIRGGRRLDPAREIDGLEGERIVGEALEALAPRGVVVVHDLALARGNVDHVAITPHGVFAIEVKHLRGGRFHIRRGRGLMQGNRPADAHAAQARRSAGALHDLLVVAGVDEWVHPVLVSSKADVWKNGFRIGKVEVIPPAALEGVLFSGPERFDADRRERIRAALLGHAGSHRGSAAG